VRKSQATMLDACARRNVDQLGPHVVSASPARFELLVRSQRVRGPGQLPECAPGPAPERQRAAAG